MSDFLVTAARPALAACLVGMIAATSTSCVSGRGVFQLEGDQDPAGVASVETNVPGPDTPHHIVTWNVHKADHEQFLGDLEKLLAGIPAGGGVALCLQEARSSTFERIKHLGGDMLSGHYAPSWRFPFSGESTGVMTVANRGLPAAGGKSFLSPGREFTFSSPKVSLLTEVPLEGGDTLQIINCHGLNFVPESAFSDQLDAVFGALASGAGPAVVCGDFNVWSAQRLAVLVEKATGAGLVEVPTDNPGKSAAPEWIRGLNGFNGFDPTIPLDRVFSRGIDVSHCYCVADLSSSDHLPIVLRFTARSPATL